MSKEYDLYLTDHRRNVQKGWEWMKDHLLPVILPWLKEEYEDVGEDILDTDDLVQYHDESKYNAIEYEPYDAYFYGGNRSRKVVDDFHRAFLFHIHTNPHHWQYWVLIHDEPEEKFEAIEMPIIYILEMICDWWSFSWREENLMEVFNWWAKNENYITLHKKTRKTVERILDEMKKILEEQNKEKSLEHSDDEEDKHKYGVPELKKFPMPDADHVRSAIKFFNYITPKYEEELANAILQRAKEYEFDISEIEVGDENRFKKYLPKKEDN